MKIGILDYGAGNTRSVQFALKRLGHEGVLSNDLDILQSCDKIIFPGVGEASSAMIRLKEHKLDTFIKETKKPVLGICLGMQLLCKSSQEGNTLCLGIIDAEVKRFPNEFQNKKFKVPQVGWNSIYGLSTKLFSTIAENTFVYYVHGYYVPICTNSIAVTDYTFVYSAALNKDNFYATQFHPEKSGAVGESILKNFIELI
ncbi:MAG: imidazole glycerol phosphate synthase subunit HisH [Flavobacteriales bacterium]